MTYSRGILGSAVVYQQQRKGILKSSGSRNSSRGNQRGGSPRNSSKFIRPKRAVSFSDNLERVHFFNPK